MAALVVQSRFAGLKIEDDDHPSSSGDGGKGKKAKLNSAKKIEPPKKAKNNNNKPQNAPKKKKNKQPAPSSEQWETWKQKDEQLVDGNFEDDLQQAILLSKLDYEEKKDVYKQAAEVEKKSSDHAKPNKKQKKKNVMSLEQFNVMMTGEDSAAINNHEDEVHNVNSKSSKSPEKDTEFFERVNVDAKKELLKDIHNDRVRFRQSVPDEVITRAQFADTLERKDKEIAQLKEEITVLKDELLKVKSRNRKLCNILGQGEMKDKAEVLVEMERLKQVHTELTAEMDALHSELQRERSRNADSRGKDKKKKGANTDKEK